MTRKNLFLSVFLFFSACTTTNQNLRDDNFSFHLAPEDTEIADYITPWNERQMASVVSYPTEGSCGGFPKIPVKTAPGFCVGVVDQGDGMIFPRTALEVAPQKIVVVDMGGWTVSNGRLYLIDLSTKPITRKTILDAATSTDPIVKRILDRPFLISRGPDEKIYLSSVSAIFRLDPLANSIEDSIELVVDELPAQGLHPLKAYAFDPQGNLYVNVGSATNSCEKQGFHFKKNRHCPEAESKINGQAQIRKYFRNNDGTYSKEFILYAKGLRNSMALIWDPKLNVLLQGENSRDDIDKFNHKISTVNLPHEELNIIEEKGHYGWPYCYDNNLNNPEWINMDCSGYKKPFKLLPAHAAPLSFIFYKGNLFPKWYRNRLLISFHGYAESGHRLVAYESDEKGLPAGDPLSFVYGWNKEILNSKEHGTPVGLTELSDGSVLVIEDKNQKILRVFYDSKLGDGTPVSEIPKVLAEVSKAEQLALKKKLDAALAMKEIPEFAMVQKQMIDKHCAGCHTGDGARGLELKKYDYIANEQRILQSKKQQQILHHLKSENGFALMPPDGFPSKSEQKKTIQVYEKWLRGLPSN